ncbi:MAG TPA: D-2-hydroxyacid dehydrogenase [Segeticoccus sp.]|nr:D-2-hydroxyacid dehydrogenase [Segeticoccus sp.]
MTDVVIATPLEPALVDRIREQEPEFEVRFDPDLLPPTRYPNDHAGEPSWKRSPDQERRFDDWVTGGEVLFGVPGETPASLRDVVDRAPALRWVQGTAAGAGQQVRAADLTAEQLRRVTFTSSVGVHARQLAEFAVLGLLAFTKDVPQLLADARARQWDHYAVRELAGQRLLVVGLGHIGRQTAQLARALGMRVTGMRRNPAPEDDELVDRMRPTDELVDAVRESDAVVLALPDTEQTRELFGKAAVDALPKHGTLVNVGRGSTVDEEALVAALREHRLAGAALDVFATEPLPDDSPLWELDNVLLSPHTAALSLHENERIVDLFIDNLGRFRRGEPLRNVVDPQRFY